MTDKTLTPAVLTAAHLSAVAQLEQLCFAEPWSERSLQLLCQANGKGVVILSEEDDTCALAYAGLTHVLDEASVTNIAVHPEFRRQGLGRAVTEALIKQAEQLCVCSLYLEVRPSNAAAIALYDSLGFERMGSRPGFYRFPTEDALVMRLALPRPITELKD